MWETHSESILARYRDRVTDLMDVGAPFAAVEDAIETFSDLDENAKAALWLLAFSMRDPVDQVRAARNHLTSVG